MKIVDEALLLQGRLAWSCEWCIKWRHCDSAHVFARGRGDVFRLDIQENLVALCRECHTRSHAGGRPTRDDLLLIVAWREKMFVDDLEEWLRHLRWAAN